MPPNESFKYAAARVLWRGVRARAVSERRCALRFLPLTSGTPPPRTCSTWSSRMRYTPPCPCWCTTTPKVTTGPSAPALQAGALPLLHQPLLQYPVPHADQRAPVPGQPCAAALRCAGGRARLRAGWRSPRWVLVLSCQAPVLYFVTTSTRGDRIICHDTSALSFRPLRGLQLCHAEPALAVPFAGHPGLLRTHGSVLLKPAYGTTAACHGQLKSVRTTVLTVFVLCFLPFHVTRTLYYPSGLAGPQLHAPLDFINLAFICHPAVGQRQQLPRPRALLPGWAEASALGSGCQATHRPHASHPGSPPAGPAQVPRSSRLTGQKTRPAVRTPGDRVLAGCSGADTKDVWL